MKLMLVVLGLWTCSLPSLAKAFDLFGQGTHYIKITQYHKNKYVGFELCHKQNLSDCNQIGSKKMYAKTQLENLRSSEKKDIVLSVLGDIGLVVVGAYGGGFVGAMAIGGGELAMLGASIGFLSGTAGSVILINIKDSLNPAEQYRQVQILNPEVLNDKRVDLDRNIFDMAHTLSTVLSNLK